MPSFTQRMVAAYSRWRARDFFGATRAWVGRASLHDITLVLGVFFAVAFGRAWLPPDFAAPWLHHVIVTVVALAAMVVVYGFGLVKFLKRESEWTRA